MTMDSVREDMTQLVARASRLCERKKPQKLFRGRLNGFWSMMLIAPCHQKHKRDAHTDHTVRYVECRKSPLFAAALPHIKSQKIHHLLPKNPVHQIPRDAANHQPERKLPQQRVRIKMVPAEIQDDQGRDGDERQEAVLPAERTPRRAGIFPIHKLEKTVD